MERPQDAPDGILIVADERPGRTLAFLSDIEPLFFLGGLLTPIILGVRRPDAGSPMHEAVFATATDPMSGVARLERFIDDARAQARRTRRIHDYIRRARIRDGWEDDED